MLVAMTPADIAKYVSDSDPAKKKVEVPVDPADASKGVKTVEEIDWDNATVFHLRPLDVYLMGAIYDDASVLRGRPGGDEIGLHTKVNKTNIDAVKFGLVNIEKFADAKGQPIRMKHKTEIVNGREYQAVDQAILDAMGIRLIGELAGKIKDISEVGKAEEKNSA